MPRPYSVDLRERVVRSAEEGLSCRETAKRFHVSVSFVIKLLQRWRQRETVEPSVFGGHKTSVLSAHADRVRSLVAAEPEATRIRQNHRLAAWSDATSRAPENRRHQDALRDGRGPRGQGSWVLPPPPGKQQRRPKWRRP